jgi:hypothetical protein
MLNQKKTGKKNTGGFQESKPIKKGGCGCSKKKKK